MDIRLKRDTSKLVPRDFVCLAQKLIDRRFNSPVSLGVIKTLSAQLLNQTNKMPEVHV